MNHKIRYLFFIFIIAMNAETTHAKGLVLTSISNESDITIDGKMDEAWDKAPILSVELNELPYEPDNGYKGAMKTDIELKSLYDDTYVYFMMSWDDKTKDSARFPWEMQKDMSWVHLKNLDSTKHENTYYEDKLAVYWNVNEKGFKKKGCDRSCHMVEDGLIDGIPDDSSGRHYVDEGEILDEWQWKSTRINVNNQIDDGYVDSEKNTNKKWGRHPDSGSGGYYNNVNEDKTAPKFENTTATDENKYYVLDKDKVPLRDNHKPGDRVGGIVTAPFIGSRADVEARGYWDGKKWHLEIKRKLLTDDKTQDLQFDDLKKIYYFGVTTFDNSQINHLYHKKSIKFTFK